MKKTLFAAIALLFAHALFADISLTDKQSTLRLIKNPNQADQGAARAANAAKRAAKHARHAHGGRVEAQSFRVAPNATGSVALVDAAGLRYFINTNITFSTSSSASGAASEASFTGPIVASTSAGGTVMSTLSDMFDGYASICVSLTGATGPCATGNPSYIMYNKNGPAHVDTSVPATAACTNRQYVFGAQTIGPLSVQRKVFVPNNDQFIRWMNIFTNTSGSSATFNMITSNNLGSDANTRIVTTSSGDNVVTTADTWVTSFQNFSGSTSSDPRIGHVMWGSGAATPISNVFFVDGDDNPFWSYNITLASGQSKIIITYATGQGTKAAAAAQAAAIDAYGPSAQRCMSATELSEVVNFVSAPPPPPPTADLSITKTSLQRNTFGGSPVSYTLQVVNSGPDSASSVVVTDPLPAGSTFTSASGAGWTCNAVSGVVTCTIPTLAVGSASPITLVFNAPSVARAGTLSNTASVSSATIDPASGNNSSTSSIQIHPGCAQP
jgi:uncharacterized repeat protein (TIGR01451 family)